MGTMTDIAVLKTQLIRCQQAMSHGACNVRSGIDWLNDFCGDFYKYAHHLQKYLGTEIEGQLSENQDVDTILLCLAQVCLCTKYLEQVIRTESTTGKAIVSSRKHFIERINWCLSRLRTVTHNMTLASNVKPIVHMTGFPFMSLYDAVMDKLHSYSSYQDDPVEDAADDIAQALFTSNEVQSTLRIMISNALALANVALIEEKTALSALCQKALRECHAFQQECTQNLQHTKPNTWDRRLKAIALETALTQLQQYVGDTICRLILIAFVDLDKFSLDKLRAKLHQRKSDETELDEFIADFDVNLDRLTQIGLFCADIAGSTKLKIFIRSIIASLEALDPCIIPSILACNRDSIHAEILEQHFCGEIAKLKTSIFESVGFRPLNNCFYEMLNTCLTQMQKEFSKTRLEDIVQMGEFILQYWQYPNNRRELENEINCNQIEYLQKFKLMLHECRAILVCADQVERMRIIKRFKILRVVMRKFLDALHKSTEEEEIKKGASKQTLILGATHTIDVNPTQLTLDTIEPTVCSILYRNESGGYTRYRRKISESMWGNNSKLPLAPLQATNGERKSSSVAAISRADERQVQQKLLRQNHSGSSGGSLRRKESLRTVMFKRQKSVEMQKACDFYMQNSASLQISEILNQLTQISSHKSNSSDELHLLNSSRLE